MDGENNTIENATGDKSRMMAMVMRKIDRYGINNSIPVLYNSKLTQGVFPLWLSNRYPKYPIKNRI